MEYYLGIDLGGTMIKTAVLDAGYKVIASVERRTLLPRDWKKILDDCAASVQDVLKTLPGLSLKSFSRVGIGTPGIVNVKTGTVETAANLGFYGVPIKDYLEKKLSLPVLVENDANAAAWGEFVAGMGKETPPEKLGIQCYTDLVSITIGTGIGSGIIINGEIFRGANGLAGELGHTVIELDGRDCPCGRKGCVNMYASASGLKQTTRDFMQKYPESALWSEAGGSLENVSGKTAFRAAEKGDKAACETVEYYIKSLAACVVNAVSIFQPQIITLSGGISKEGEKLLEPLRRIAEKECLRGPNTALPSICAGKLQDKAGVVGAALLGTYK
ncbi:ROK family protein [Treponema sp. HNW]|uniref:ROK family protein n=1 Tax=Treponema sp. HNW TaxID=3116654 RepID=UPI003D0E621B